MRFHTRSRRKPTVNIVSLIDILAILLIFFIVTTTFKDDQPQVRINLPESTTAVEAPAASEPALVLIDSGNLVYFEGEQVTLEALSERIEHVIANDPGRGFALKADEAAGFGTVIRVMDIFQENDVRDLPAFTDLPGAGAPAR